MKVGFANCFLPASEQLGGLWVGYAGTAIPEVSPEGLCLKGEAEKADLRYMAVASSERWRNNVRVVTYSKDALLVWQITGSIKPLTQTDDGINWKDPSLYQSFGADWNKEVAEEFDGISSQKFIEHHFGPKGWKLLPAKLIHTISRERLIAPIDSLSVWRSFSQNTFQPMFTLEGNSNLANLSWLTSSEELGLMPITKEKVLKENRFGKFIRIYLDQKLAATPDSKITDAILKEAQKTALSILNPAQLETAAMLICQDLGLTIDVGLGKGLDVADVKATVRHLEANVRKAKIQTAINSLQGLMKFSDPLLHSFLSTATLRVQCKAASGVPSDGTVLTLEPCSQMKMQTDRVALEDLVSSNVPLPRFTEWMQLLEFDLTAR